MLMKYTEGHSLCATHLLLVTELHPSPPSPLILTLTLRSSPIHLIFPTEIENFSFSVWSPRRKKSKWCRAWQQNTQAKMKEWRKVKTESHINNCPLFSSPKKIYSTSQFDNDSTHNMDKHKETKPTNSGNKGKTGNLRIASQDHVAVKPCSKEASAPSTKGKREINNHFYASHNSNNTCEKRSLSSHLTHT